MIYDTNWSPDNTMNNSTGIREWWDAEHIPYNLAFDNTTFNQVKNHFYLSHIIRSNSSQMSAFNF